MKRLFKSLSLFPAVAAGFFYLALPAAAQENHHSPSLQAPAAEKTEEAEAPGAANLLTVTSIQKCYAQLDRSDVLDIQQNYAKPYQECQRRLALKLKNEQTVKAGSSAKAEEPEKSGGFISVSPARKTEEPKVEAKKPAFLQDKVPLK